MHILAIENYHTTLELHADDCLTLALALRLASHAATLPNLDVATDGSRASAPEWAALALFLEASALASESAPQGAWESLYQERPRVRGASLPPVPWPARTASGRKTDQASAALPDALIQSLHERAADAFGEEAAWEVFAGVLMEGEEAADEVGEGEEGADEAGEGEETRAPVLDRNEQPPQQAQAAD